MKEKVYMGTVFFLFASFAVYSYLETQNTYTGLQMQLPKKEREKALFAEEIQRLAYEVERFESPAHLIEVAMRPEFRHLKHPLIQEVLSIPEAIAANEP